MKRDTADRKVPNRLQAKFFAISWRDLALPLGPMVLLTLAAAWAAYHFVRPAPPDTITITTGVEGGRFRTAAERYRQILARNGITLQILPSEGSVENLRRPAKACFTATFRFGSQAWRTGCWC